MVAGPTAVGKTEFAVMLAEHLGTEIISADSRQIYREMSIGTAKPSDGQRARVKHHFIDSHSIHENYDAGQYGRDAQTRILEILGRHNEVVLCGGSGLYIKAVCEGFDDLPDVPEEMRAAIRQQYEQEGMTWLQGEVQRADEDFFRSVDRQNPQRLMRALELMRFSQKKMSELRVNKRVEHDFQVVKIGLRTEREVLYQRIDQRMDQMIADGLFEEAKALYPHRDKNALQTVGYTEIFGFMEGRYDQTEAIRLLKRNSRHYAKRQLTWFNRDTNINWFKAIDLSLTLKEVLLFLETQQ